MKKEVRNVSPNMDEDLSLLLRSKRNDTASPFQEKPCETPLFRAGLDGL
jgi:hypothetical protein